MSRLDAIAAWIRGRYPQSAMRIYTCGETWHYAGTQPMVDAFDYADPMRPDIDEPVRVTTPEFEGWPRFEMRPKAMPGHRLTITA